MGFRIYWNVSDGILTFSKYISIARVPTFYEWTINMRINNDASDILYASNSTNGGNSNMSFNWEEEKGERTKNCKGESLLKQQASVLQLWAKYLRQTLDFM